VCIIFQYPAIPKGRRSAVCSRVRALVHTFNGAISSGLGAQVLLRAFKALFWAIKALLRAFKLAIEGFEKHFFGSRCTGAVKGF
jgi:hypothetical protein